MGKYVEFISDKDFEEAVRNLISTYEKVKDEKTYSDFTQNKIDPIKFIFDKIMLDQTDEDQIKAEIVRQINRTISNAIGNFHEELIGKIDGYERYPVGNGYDIKAKDNSLYADIKNKHNTVKGSDKVSLYQNLEKYVEKSDNPHAKGFWVQMISSGKSFHENWTLTVNDKDEDGKDVKKIFNNKKIFKISGDKFYELLTGRKNAFYEVCIALPSVINKVKNEIAYKEVAENTQVLKDLRKISKEEGHDITTVIFNNTFKNYNGFPIEPKDLK